MKKLKGFQKGHPFYIGGEKGWFKETNGIHSYRKRAFEQKGSMCKICGSNQKINVHHKDKDRQNNKIDNLEVLCTNCHAKIHENWKNAHKNQSKRYCSIEGCNKIHLARGWCIMHYMRNRRGTL